MLEPRDDFYENKWANPDDVLLLIEVAESSLAFDRNRKRRLYQQAGVRDYWIINVSKRVIEVYRGADPTLIVRRGETLTPLALPDLVVPADTLLG